MQTISYMGTLDDVVLRYPWTHHNQSTDISNQLINAAIYDQKIAINDGYLVANKELLPSLSDIGGSLLGNMLQSQSAVLFSRSEPRNIAAGIEKSAEKIETHRQIVTHKNWSSTRESLEILQKSLVGTTLCWPQDKNMSGIFYKAMNILFSDGRLEAALPDNLRSDFENIFKNFTDQLDSNYNSARDIWEKLCWQYYEGIDIDPFTQSINTYSNYEKIRVLMGLANEAYHIAYSCGLNHSIDTDLENLSVRPMTAYCPAYNDMFLKVENNDIDYNNLQKLGKFLLSVNSVNFKNDANYSWIQDLQFNSELRGMRRHYVVSLNNFIYGKCTFNEMHQITQEYSNALSARMTSQVKLSRLWARSAIGVGVSVAISTQLGVAAGLGVLGISYYFNKNGAKIFEKLINIPSVKHDLARDGIQAINYRQSEKMARDLGLINAVLDEKKVQYFLDDVLPFNP